jgi:phosphate-selective porin OprO and OprP
VKQTLKTAKTFWGGVGLPAVVTTTLLAGVTGAFAQANDSLQTRLDELDQKIRVIERLNEIAQEEAKAASAKAPKVSADDRGLGLSSADGSFALKYRGFTQFSTAHILGKAGTVSSTTTPSVTTSAEPTLNSNYTIRRLQSDITGTAFKNFDWRTHIDFAGGAATLLDVNLDWKIQPELNLRVGKFKPPTGLERLISSPRAPFIEGSFVTLLQPNRDIGIQLFGTFGKGLLEYQAGLFDGARDGQNNTGDNNNEKDFYGRLFAHPFTGKGEWLEGFGLGISGSTGKQAQYNNVATTATVVTATNGTTNTPSAGSPSVITTTAAVSNGIASYSTGRQVFFSYAANDTSVGTVTRYSPQAYYYAGPLGVIAEYSATTQNLRRAAFEQEITNAAWALTASWFITGEKNSYKGIKVKKANTFPKFDGMGALEVLGRVHGLKIDDKVFAPLNSADLRVTYADAAKQASEVLGYGLALGWYLNNTVKIFASYEQVDFTGGTGTSATATLAPVVADRESEKVFSLSFNVAY